MEANHPLRFMLSALVSGALLLAQPLSVAQTNLTLPLEKTFSLPGISGKFDHFAADLPGNRLFLAAAGDRAIGVLDLQSGKLTQTITGLGKPHGLAWVAETPAGTATLYASDGKQADLKFYGGWPLKQSSALQLSDDADDMVFDTNSKLLYVGHGGSDAANPAEVAVVDTASHKLVASLAVKTHPEALEIDPVRDRIFVNVADAAEIAIIDGHTHAIVDHWQLTRAKDNVPLAYDAGQQVLFVGCRTPARLLVLDGNSGKEIADLPADAGADDLFYDDTMHRVYLIAGSGAVDVYEIDSAKHVRSLGVTHTATGAKTGLFVPSQHALYVGVPGSTDKPSEIRVFSTAAQ
jgi:hypothetical protein